MPERAAELSPVLSLLQVFRIRALRHHDTALDLYLELIGVKMLATIMGVALIVSAGPCAAQTISPTRLLEVADISAPVVSPDGLHVAYRVEQASVARNTYDSVWYVQPMDGGAAARRVGDGGTPLRDSAGESLPPVVTWSPDGRYIYYRALMEGRIDVWRAATDGSGAERVTVGPADVRDFSLSDAGKILRYKVGAARDQVLHAELDEYRRGIRIDETVPVGAGLFRSRFIGGRLATQRYSGSWFARGLLLDDTPERWIQIDLSTRERRELSATSIESEGSSRDFVPDEAPTSTLVATDPTTGRIALVTPLEQKDGEPATLHAELRVLPHAQASSAIKCHAELCTNRWITDAQWRPGSDEVLFTVTDRSEGHAQSIFRWNISTGAVVPVVQSQGLLTGGRDHYRGACGVSAEALACVRAKAARPPRLERINIESGQRYVLFDPNAALAMDLQERISSRLLRWADELGHDFSGQLLVARDRKEAKGPLFVTYYSCSGFLRGGVGDEWPLASLAEAGISALCINARPYHPDPVVRYEMGRSAVASAIEMLASEGVVDPSRVGMGGLSFGSEVALWVAVESDLLAAVSVTSPSVSPLYFLLNSLKGEPFLSSLRENWGLGWPEETPEQWRRVSPAYNTDRIRAPVLLQMPEEEYIHALDYVAPLIQRQLADLYVFPEEAHQKFQPRHKDAAYERNLDWFRFWLQGVEDDDPRKTEQYKHWRLMREAASNPPRATRMDKF